MILKCLGIALASVGSTLMSVDKYKTCYYCIKTIKDGGHRERGVFGCHHHGLDSAQVLESTKFRGKKQITGEDSMKIDKYGDKCGETGGGGCIGRHCACRVLVWTVVLLLTLLSSGRWPVGWGLPLAPVHWCPGQAGFPPVSGRRPHWFYSIILN